MKRSIDIDYYTDILCIWAYLAQVRVDELQREFGDQVRIHYKFVNLFGNTGDKLAGMDGGAVGYSAHVNELVEHFPHVSVHPQVWQGEVPKSSLPVHLALKAVQLMEQSGQAKSGVSAVLSWQLRQAFFQRRENIADWEVLQTHLRQLAIPLDTVQRRLGDGSAAAALCVDLREQNERAIEGSPTFWLNEGRQKLYGNVGYRVIAANVQELLEREIDLPDWC